MEITVYEQAPACQRQARAPADDWRSASWLRKKKPIRGSEPREQVRTARRGSQNPQGRTWFSKTGRWFHQPTLRFLSKSDSAFLTVAEASLIHAKTSKVFIYIYIYNIYIYIYESTELEPSVSEPRHPFICCLSVRVSKENNVLPNRAQCQKRQTTRKQAVPESEARTLSKTRLRRPLGRPSQRPGRGGATVLFCLRKQNGCMHHATGAFTPRPRVLACSCFVSLRFPAPEQRHDWKNCKQLAHNRQARKRGL